MVIPWSNWNLIELIGIILQLVPMHNLVLQRRFHTVYTSQSEAHSSYDSAHNPDIQKQANQARPDVTYVMLVKIRD